MWSQPVHGTRDQDRNHPPALRDGRPLRRYHRHNRSSVEIFSPKWVTLKTDQHFRGCMHGGLIRISCQGGGQVKSAATGAPRICAPLRTAFQDSQELFA
jgi:hypothetical protein